MRSAVVPGRAAGGVHGAPGPAPAGANGSTDAPVRGSTATPDATLLDRAVALGSLTLVGLNLSVIEGVTTGAAAALVLTPVWWRATRSFVGARTLLGLGALAVVSGLWLAAHSAGTHEVSLFMLRASVLTLVGGLATIGLVLWARTVLPMRALVLAFAAGVLAHMVLEPPNPVNPWKFGIAFALAVTLLGASHRGRPRPVEVAVLLLLGAASAVNDSRSAFATMVLAGVLVAWQLRPTTLSHRASGVATLFLLGALAVCVYFAGTALIVEGYLGQETRARSLEQLEASGSLLLGGRPEWGASAALFLHQPWGYGPGVQAGLEDVLVAKSGMAALNYDPNNGYVENYMFGAEMKLHAVIPDLWITYGIPGLVFGLTLAGLLAWSVATAIARRTAAGVVLYLACLTAWNLVFGPIVSSIDDLVLTMGVVLLARSTAPAAQRAGR